MKDLEESFRKLNILMAAGADSDIFETFYGRYPYAAARRRAAIKKRKEEEAALRRAAKIAKIRKYEKQKQKEKEMAGIGYCRGCQTECKVKPVVIGYQPQVIKIGRHTAKRASTVAVEAYLCAKCRHPTNIDRVRTELRMVMDAVKEASQ